MQLISARYPCLVGKTQSRKTTRLVRLIGGLTFFQCVMVLATEPVVREKHIQLLLRLDVIVAVLFLIEYLARL